MPEPESPLPRPHADHRFATTCWTQVVASQGDSTQAAAALGQLCEDYYEPVVAFIRYSERRAAAEPRDLAHGFFAHVLDGHAFDGADPDQGHFRSYLLGAVKHFLAQHWTRAGRKKRGGEAAITSIDGGISLRSDAVAPDEAFDRRWATTVLDRALDALELEFEGAGDGELFQALRPWLTGDSAHGDQAGLAERLGLAANTLKSQVSRLRKRFRQCVRDEIARTLADPAQIDAEMQALLAALRKK